MKSRRKQRITRINPAAYLVGLQGACLLGHDDQLVKANSLALPVRLIKLGQADREAWDAVFDCLNMTEELLKNPKVAKGGADYIESKQAVIVAILDRQACGASKALHAAEVAALDDLAALWADLLGQVTHAEYFAAQQAVETRMRLVAAGCVPEGVRVVRAV